MRDALVAQGIEKDQATGRPSTGGVRWDYFDAGYPDHDTGTSRYRPASATFPGQQVVGFKDIQPRLGMAYDLFGNGRTALKASVGRCADRDSNTRAGSVLSNS